MHKPLIIPYREKAPLHGDDDSAQTRWLRRRRL